jgi:branched-chain amino acid transport system substrate-binding protein
MDLTRRHLFGGTAATALLARSGARAQTARPLRLGVLTDMSGAFRNNGGPTAVACVNQAVHDFDPASHGLSVEVLVADHQNKADIGVAIARHWYDEDGVDVILDVNNSAVAMALISVAQDKDKLQLNTGAGTGDLTGPRCAYNTVHWGYDTYVFSASTGGQVLRSGGKTWFFITADYAFGHASEKDATMVIEKLGGKVLGGIAYPGAGATSDFSSQILQAQSSGADVIGLATSGTDFVNIIKQCSEFGIMKRGQRIAGLSVFINDIHGLGLQAAQGIFLTETFYWDLNDRTRAFMNRVKGSVGDNWPSMEQAGAYSAATHYLKAAAQVGPAAAKASGRAVMDVMRKMPTDDDCFGQGRIREDGVVLHPSYLFQVKTPAESHQPWDYYKLISTTPADQAWRPLNETGCPLVK